MEGPPKYLDQPCGDVQHPAFHTHQTQKPRLLLREDVYMGTLAHTAVADAQSILVRAVLNC